MVTGEWFKRWPLSEPPANFVAKQGSVEKAQKLWRSKKVEVSIVRRRLVWTRTYSQQQLKRVFKSRGAENTTAGVRSLHLEDGAPRKKSEVQMYMILYYDTRIRETVVKRWAEDRVPSLEYRVELDIPEDEVEPCESYNMKDQKIPITYKNAIAQELYEAESEMIKMEVRSQREAWYEGSRTVRTDDEDQREILVREYQRYVHSLLQRHP